VLIEDTPGGFCAGLREIVRRRGEFDSRTIRSGVSDHEWQTIVQGNLHRYLSSL
jgi:hypothetical protein